MAQPVQSSPLMQPPEKAPEQPPEKAPIKEALAAIKNRCPLCRRKISWAEPECGKCNKIYCAAHRALFSHQCSGKRELEKKEESPPKRYKGTEKGDVSSNQSC